MSEHADHVELEDPSILLVKGSKGDRDADRDYVKKLGNAVQEVFGKHDMAKLRCVGPAALNNAMKAFIIARGEYEKKGEELIAKACFVTVDFGGVEKTGILIEVEKR